MVWGILSRIGLNSRKRMGSSVKTAQLYHLCNIASNMQLNLVCD